MGAAVEVNVSSSQGTIEDNLSGDGFNVYLIDGKDPDGKGAIAKYGCYPKSEGSCEAFDCDIWLYELNGDGTAWSFVTGAAAPTTHDVSLVYVFAHELGHAQGLGENDTEPGFHTIMRPYTDTELDSGLAFTGIEEADEDALVYLYGKKKTRSKEPWSTDDGLVLEDGGHYRRGTLPGL